MSTPALAIAIAIAIAIAPSVGRGEECLVLPRRPVVRNLQHVGVQVGPRRDD